MPELPEVETTRRGLAPGLIGQQIVAAVVRQPSLRLPVSENLHSHCQGQIIQSIERRSKYLLIHLQQGCLLVHLGMSGHLRMVSADTPIGKHDHIDLVLANGQVLRYQDPRRFGLWLFLASAYHQHALLQKLGPEPLTEAFNSQYLHQRLKGKKQPIKTAIMDNHVLVGVGNIYASESLFRAGVHPLSPAGNLTLVQVKRLVQEIKAVLAAAIEAGGTTLKDFYAADGKPGYFSISLQVYGRQGAPCLSCGQTIQSTKLAGRNTFFCGVCQILS